MPEEDVVSLVVEGDGSLAHELRLVVEQGGQHPEEENKSFFEISDERD